MIFKGWRKTSLIEYPGKIATVLFVGGCNFRCPFCYNAHLVTRSRETPDITQQSVLDYLRENTRLYQAVVVTGGEPTRYEELPGFFARVKDMGFCTGLETNGTNPDMLKSLSDAGILDYVGMDIKTSLVFEKYARASGVEDEGLFQKVLESIELLPALPSVDYEFRMTLVPGLHEREDILELGNQLGGVKHLVLQKFIPKGTLDKSFEKRDPFPPGFMGEMEELLKDRFESCSIRNL